jgi:hypothetical protein
VAISHDEAEGDIQNGWEEFDPTESTPAPVENALQPRRRGRPARQELVV